MADNLSRLLQSTKKYDKLRSSYENTIQSNMKEEVSLRPKVDFLKKETKEWQKLVSLMTSYKPLICVQSLERRNVKRF